MNFNHEKLNSQSIKTKPYTLMNKNIELMDVEISNGVFIRVDNIKNYEFMPIMILSSTKSENFNLVETLNNWWRKRRIPASRDGIKEIIESFKNFSDGDYISNLDHLLERALGLSLTDQYWIRPFSNMKWKDINFFTNDFSDDIGKILGDGNWLGDVIQSPDAGLDGVIKKKWKIINNVRYLVKGSSGYPWYAQPFREVLAGKIAETLMKPFDSGYATNYQIINDNGEIFSICPCFITENIEYVPFQHFYYDRQIATGEKQFEYIKSFYDDKSFVLDIMIILDYLIINTDRHLGNFGLIRSAETGDIIRPAPIFDTGNSLFYASRVFEANQNISKPFLRHHEEQIKLVDLNLYQESLQLLKKDFNSIFQSSFVNSSEGKDRLSEISNIVSKRIEKLLVFS